MARNRAERRCATRRRRFGALAIVKTMLEVEVPGWQTLRLELLILDVNGTLTRDGAILPGVHARITTLKGLLEVRLLSADTFGRLDSLAVELGVDAQSLGRGEPEAEQKGRLVRELGAERIVAIGNGANDVAMLKEAALGIAVLGPEGLAVPALIEADLVTASIEDALDLLLNAKRLVATLRR
jgi:soluble P-type ATPase